MNAVGIVVILLAMAAGLRLVAQRINVPHPVLLVLGGLALAFVPNAPRLSIDPETLFIVFVPPLLYWAALTTSLREFRQQAGPIGRYATVVVLITIVAVAAVAKLVLPELSWAAAFILGAIVSPPDPIAAIAVLRPIGAPRAVVTVLEGEGLVNDATALIAYQIALAAAVTGAFSLSQAAGRFVIAGAGGVVIGLGVGWLIAWVRRRIGRFPIVENTVSLLTPFLAYLPAAWLDTSGVLAVVAVGLYLGRLGPTIVAPATRVQAESMWTMVTFLLESLAFIFIGLELPLVVKGLSGHSLTELAGYGALITVAAVIVRMIYTLAAVFVLNLVGSKTVQTPDRWREAVFIGWTGMRGADSLVIALALPVATATGVALPGRGIIIVLTFAVIFGTLVVQGFTVAPLARWLRLRPDGLDESEEAHARRVAIEAGLLRLSEATDARAGTTAQSFAVQHLRASHERRLRKWSARDLELHTQPANAAVAGAAPAPQPASDYQALRLAMIAAERSTVIELRDKGRIGEDVMRRLQRDLDLETMLLESAGDDPFDAAKDE